MFGIKEIILKNIQLFKDIANPKDLRVWEKLLVNKTEDRVTNFDISSENDLIRKYCGQSPEVLQSVRKS